MIVRRCLLVPFCFSKEKGSISVITYITPVVLLGFCVVCLLFSWIPFWKVMHPFQVNMLCAINVFYFRGRLLSDFQCGWLKCRTMLTVLNTTLAFITVWLTMPMGKMKQILCSDWPPEPIFAVWDYLHWSHTREKILCEAGCFNTWHFAQYQELNCKKQWKTVVTMKTH